MSIKRNQILSIAKVFVWCYLAFLAFTFVAVEVLLRTMTDLNYELSLYGIDKFKRLMLIGLPPSILFCTAYWRKYTSKQG